MRLASDIDISSRLIGFGSAAPARVCQRQPNCSRVPCDRRTACNRDLGDHQRQAEVGEGVHDVRQLPGIADAVDAKAFAQQTGSALSSSPISGRHHSRPRCPVPGV